MCRSSWSWESGFINSILKYGNKKYFCESRSDWKGVTKELDIKFIGIGSDRFYFIETPGLNEANVSEERVFECSPFRVHSRPCPRSVREVSEGRYLEVNFKLQCSYIHFFRGHFADRGVNGHEIELSQKKR